ncbi:hypothetical protein IWQ62_005232 [Dispira parvispora]|uniref:Uncharacterized protein n=1 Tax=Dispira parvispora TaxID=1520584 RepID=A0A9W8ARD4_9FUNG|nr:hypothetical protein IWQ62_005232 [Dispira parvispora]
MSNLAASPITSVQPQSGAMGQGFGAQPQGFDTPLPDPLYVNMRGTEFVLTRQMLMNLPESVLGPMFPNGIILSPRTKSQSTDSTAQATTTPATGHLSALDSNMFGTGTGLNGTAPMDLVYVDFHPELFRYIFEFYQRIMESPAADDASHSNPPAGDQPTMEYTSMGDMSDDSMVTALTSQPGVKDGNQQTRQGQESASNAANGNNTSQLTNQSMTTTSLSDDTSLGSSGYMPYGSAPLYYQDKPAVIVLREDLDYFTIVKPYVPKNAAAEQSGKAPQPTTDMGPMSLAELKQKCGEIILEQHQVFSALERNMRHHQDRDVPGDDNASPEMVEDNGFNQSSSASATGGVEQQLIDMLCVSGFARSAQWGCRVREPLRTSVTSLALVRLEPTGDPAQAIAAQKLLLFYKKPARKCWWDGVDVRVNNTLDDIPVRVWCRRMWTLELAMVDR